MLYYNITKIFTLIVIYPYITSYFGNLMSPIFHINRLREPDYTSVSSVNFSIRRVTTVFSVTTALGMASLSVNAKDTMVDIKPMTSSSFHLNSPDTTHPSVTLDTIVVTSNPLLPQANEMATATSIVTGDALTTQTSSTLGDALANEVGVSTDSFGQGASRPIIRGQSAPRVQVMQNGLSVQDASQISPDHQVAVPVLGAKQVEVIKGTSALMYGGGAIGGVVNIVNDTIPKEKPKNNINGKLALIGQQATDGYLGYAELNGSIGENWLWSGYYQKTDKGNIQVPHLDTDEIANSWYTQDNGSIGLSYVTDMGYIGASYQRLSSEYGLPFHVHNECSPDSVLTNQLSCEADHEHDHDHGEAPYVDMTSNVYQLHAERKLPMIGVDSINTKLSYTDYRHDEIDEGAVGTTFENKAISAQAQATHSTYKTGNLGFMKGVVGLDYTNSRFSAVGLEGYLPQTDRTQVGLFFIERLTPDYFGAKIQNADKFAGQSLSASDAHAGHNHGETTATTSAPLDTSSILRKQGKSPWYIEFGGRQDFQNLIDNDNNIEKTHAGTSVSLEGGKYLTPNTQLSARISHSERLPSPQELFSNGAHLATNTWERGNGQLEEESTDGVEFTLRYDNGNRFDSSISVFYNDSTNYIYAKTQDIATEGESAGFRLVDYVQSDAKHYGGEIQSRYYLNDNISIGSFADIALITLDDASLTRKYAPRLVAPRIGGDITSQFGQFDLVLSGYHRFEQDHIADFETNTPSYNMVDAKLVYHSSSAHDYTAFFQVENILNELAYNHASYLAEQVPMPERSLNAGITYNF